MRRPILIIFSVIGIFLLLGTTIMYLFGARTNNTFSNTSRDLGGFGGAPAATMAPAAEEAPALDSSAYDQSQDTFNRAAQAQDRLVIQNADLAIVVKDPKTRMQEISDLAKEFGGFVVSSNLYQSPTALGKEVTEASIVIRVPSERLDEALARIKEGAVDIDYENRLAEDVTNIYVDLQSQLKAKEAAAEKLLEIMDQATRAEDVLAIYLQVQAVQTEIEVLKGQIKYYEESAALSAISVRLIAEEGTQPIEVGPWSLGGAAKEAIQDLIFFVQNFTEFLIRFVLYTLPALILIGIPLYLAFLGGRALIRRFRKPNEKVEPSEEVKK